MWLLSIKGLKVTDKLTKKHNDKLAIEKETELLINNTKEITFSHYPGLEKELAIGYLKSKQIESLSSDIKVQGNKLLVNVNVSSYNNRPLTPSKEKTHWSKIFQLTAFFQEKALLFKETAITESAAIASEDELLTFSEDLHQINSLYKCIGLLMENNLSKKAKILLISSKIDKETVVLAQKLNIFIIISRIAPTSLAKKHAEENNMCLIGFARGKKYTVYCNEYMITYPRPKK
jgi:formate dehydrogenase assembly factor FdhD